MVLCVHDPDSTPTRQVNDEMSLFYRIAFVAARFLVVDGKTPPDDPAQPGCTGPLQRHDQGRPPMPSETSHRQFAAPMRSAWGNQSQDRSPTG